jgi:hypothetical protein
VSVQLVDTQKIDGGWRLTAQTTMAGLPVEDVAVQAFAEPAFGEVQPVVAPMTYNGKVYTADLITTRPAAHFTVRVVPSHPHALVPLEAWHVRWANAAVVAPSVIS